MTLLSGFVPVAGPCFYLKISLGCKALTVRTYVPVFRRKMSRIVQGRWSQQVPPQHYRSHVSTRLYGVTSQKTRTVDLHHHEDLIYLKKFEEFVTGAPTVLVQVWFTNFILRVWSLQGHAVSQHVMLILNVACLCATPYITSFE